MKTLLSNWFYLITFILVFTIAAPKSDCFAQLKAYDVIGGGGSTPAQSESNDNTVLYIVAGVAVAGLIAYYLLSKTDNKEEKDTTATIGSELNLVNLPASIEDEVLIAKEKLPLNIFFGIRNDDAILRNKTILVGISVKL